MSDDARTLPPPVTHAQWARERGYVTVTNLTTGESVDIAPRHLTPVWRFDLDEHRRIRLSNGAPS